MEWVKLNVRVSGGTVVMEVPGVVTVKYAALRVAERLGQDPEGAQWVLAAEGSRTLLDPDAPVSEFGGATVYLGYLRN